jgi:hypothetical protein
MAVIMNESEAKEAPSPPVKEIKPRQPPRRDGHSTRVIENYKQLKKALDTCVLDKRTKASKELHDVQETIVEHLGGWERISAQQVMVVESLARTYVLLKLVDSYAFTNGLIIDKRKRKMHRILIDRTRLADSMLKHAALLGLERKFRSLA